MKKSILLLWLSLMLCPMAFGATESPAERQHIILAFDGATLFNRNNQMVKDKVNDILFGEKGIVKEGDFLSVVCTAGNANQYADPLVKVRLSWIKAEGDNVKQKLANGWSNYVKCDWFSPGSDVYSLLSITKPYILEALNCNDTTNYVDKTLILYVTDNIYNGSDYYLESLYFLNNLTKSNNFYASLNKLMAPCAKVAKEYSIQFVEGDYVDVGNRAYIDRFELIHNYHYINLPTVLSHRHIIEAKRQFGGDYTFDFDIKAYNDHFDVLSIEAYGHMCQLNEEVEGLYQQIYKRNELALGQSDIISGEFHRSTPYDALHLKCLIHINEDIYGATRFSIEHDVEIVLEPDATIIFGMFRLPDFLWLPWCDDQYEVAVGIDIIFVILVIIAFVIYILCRRSYTPTNDDIIMGFYDVTNKE